MAHYRLTRETKRIGNKALYRVQATAAIEKYNIGAGDLGGWIEGEHNLSMDGLAWVGDDAMVMDQALVTGDAAVAGNSFVDGLAKISGSARVYGDAEIGGEAIITGNAEVFGRADIGGSVLLSGDAQVHGEAVLDSNMQLMEPARIAGGTDYLQIQGLYYLLLYRTEDGHSKLPDRLPESLEPIVAEQLAAWGLTAPTTV